MSRVTAADIGQRVFHAELPQHIGILRGVADELVSVEWDSGDIDYYPHGKIMLAESDRDVL
jgi:hypothetical protein